MFDHQQEDAESAEATHCKKFIGSTGIREEDARLATNSTTIAKFFGKLFGALWSSKQFIWL